MQFWTAVKKDSITSLLRTVVVHINLKIYITIAQHCLSVCMYFYNHHQTKSGVGMGKRLTIAMDVAMDTSLIELTLVLHFLAI